MPRCTVCAMTASNPRHGDVHRRVALAIRLDRTRTQSRWAQILGLSPQALSARMLGRTPFSLEQALEVAFRLGTTVDALRDGSYVARLVEPEPARTEDGDR